MAGAWPMPVGKGQVISTTVSDRASRAYDETWALSREVEFSKFDSQFYWEHGVTPKITFLGTTAYQDVDFESREGQTSVQGFGNSTLGLRYQIFAKNRTVAAVQGRYVWAGKGENITDADLGRGGNGVEFTALAGQSFKVLGREGFVDLQSSWTIRGGNAPHSFKDDITVGLHLTPRLQVIGQGFYSQTGSELIGFDRILANESFKLQGSFVLKRSKKTSVQFGVFRTVIGRNTVQEVGTFAGVWRRY